VLSELRLAAVNGHNTEIPSLFLRLWAHSHRDIPIDAHLLYQRTLLCDARHDELLKFYADALEEERSPKLLYLYARLIREPKEEEAYYREGLRLDTSYGFLHAGLASALRRQERYVQAVDEFKAAFALDGMTIEPGLLFLDVLERLGTLKDHLEYLRGFVHQSAPMSAPAVVAILAHIRLGLLERADTLLRDAIAQHPGDPDVLWAALHHAWAQGDINRSSSLITDCLTIAPTHVGMLRDGGMLRWGPLAVDPSAELVKQARRIDPSDAEAATCLGAALAANGMLDEATNHLKAAIRLDPIQPEAYRLLGTMLLDAGKAAEGLTYLSRATHLEPRNKLSWLTLASAAQVSGDLAQAAAAISALNQVATSADASRLRRNVTHVASLKYPTTKARVRSLITLQASFCDSDDLRSALYCVELLRQAEPKQVNHATMSGVIQSRLREFDGAADAFASAATVATLSQDRSAEMRAAIRSADALYDCGQVQRAQQQYSIIARDFIRMLSPEDGLLATVRAMQAGSTEGSVVALPVHIAAQPRLSCAFASVAAILKYWSIAYSEAAIRIQDKDPHAALPARLVEWLSQRTDAAVACFVADRHSVNHLLAAGVPVLLFKWLSCDGTYVRHACVITGSDSARGVFMTEDPAWSIARPLIPYAAIDGCRAIAIVPKGFTAVHLLMLPGMEYTALLNRAEMQALGSQWTEARDLFEIIVRRFSDQPLTYELYAGACEANDLLSEAATLYASGTLLAHAHPTMWMGAGRTLAKHGELHQAKEAFASALGADPTYVRAALNRAEILYGLKDNDEYLQATLELLTIAPADGLAHFHRGAAFLREAQWLSARDELQAAIAMSREPRAYTMLAYAFDKLGQRADAIRVLEGYQQQLTDAEEAAQVEQLVKKLKRQ
jgi:tetratricopeptide (TPR) repeat protein